MDVLAQQESRRGLVATRIDTHAHVSTSMYLCHVSMSVFLSVCMYVSRYLLTESAQVVI